MDNNTTDNSNEKNKQSNTPYDDVFRTLLEEGHAKGREEGREEEKADNIVRLMSRLGMSFRDACKFLDVPKELEGKYQRLVEEKLKEERKQKKPVLHRNVKRGR